MICGVVCVVFHDRLNFACVRLENQKSKDNRCFLKHDPIIYAGHISHLFKITAILIGVFLFRFLFLFISVNFSLLYGADCGAESGVCVRVCPFCSLNI